MKAFLKKGGRAALALFLVLAAALFLPGSRADDILKLITEEERWDKQDESEDSGVDYAAEYKKQTGRDLATGEFVTQ